MDRKKILTLKQNELLDLVNKKNEVQNFRDGYGEGGFVVIKSKI